MSDGYASTRRLTVKVNALGGERAMDLALDAAGDRVFSESACEWDDADLPDPKDTEAFEFDELGGYEVVLLRRAYSNSPGGSAHSADYAVEAASGPIPIYENPDIQDRSEAYIAEKNRIELSGNTVSPLSGKRAGARL